MVARITDNEDSSHHHSAVDAGYACIVTYDKWDWWFAEMNVDPPQDFLLRKVIRSK